MCDTFVILPEYTKNGATLLGKNSDREPDEVQNIVFLKGDKHSSGEKVKCTYLEIPQAEETYDVIISQPFWMFGCEMGANQFGVVIGNEAVFTTELLSKDGLLGMDMIRLALERTKSAKDALNLIIKLLETYGQGGNCGYHKKENYHNSWIIADPKTAFVLETAGKHWVWKQIQKNYSISNVLSIEKDFDAISEGTIDYAIKKGRCKSADDFSFRKAFIAHGLNMSAIQNMGAKGDSRRAFHHSQACCVADAKSATILDVMKILRSHQPEKLKKKIDSYDPGINGSFNDICVHASGLLVPSQSVNSIAVESSEKCVEFWTTCGSAPCTQLYRPLILEKQNNGISNYITIGSEKFDSSKIWWKNEVLHRLVLQDYQNRLSLYASERDLLEKEWVETLNKKDLAQKRSFSDQCFEIADKKVANWIDTIKKESISAATKSKFIKYWNKLNIQNGIRF